MCPTCHGRVPAGKVVGDEDVQCAADLAAFFSKGRQEGMVDVMLTKAAWLKKMKGAKPGQVGHGLSSYKKS